MRPLKTINLLLFRIFLLSGILENLTAAESASAAVHPVEPVRSVSTNLPETVEIEDGHGVLQFRVESEFSPAKNTGRQAINHLPAPRDSIRLHRLAGSTADGNLPEYLTSRLNVEMKDRAQAEAIAKLLGARTFTVPVYAPEHVILTFESPSASWKAAQTLKGHPAVLKITPIVAREHSKRLVPGDALFSTQWGLLNSGQNGARPGVDIQITNVWNEFRGAGIVIGVVDDGVHYPHPDLVQNVDLSLSYDYLDSDSDPLPTSLARHGTPVSGIIGARGNNLIGIAGVAFESRMAAIRLIGPGEGDDQEAASLSHSNQVISIYNNSWGGSDNGQTVGGLGPLLRKAMAFGTTNGRNGRGNIYVWAAGNGGLNQDNVNYDTYANNPHVIAVGSVNDNGLRAAYSEPGACLLICAPAGDPASRPQAIATTDLPGSPGFNSSGSDGDFSDTDYTRVYSGTSASAPFVSGVIALMLQANPQLGWRDVKEILLRSATRIDSGNSDWIVNGAGFRLSHFYGAGLLNAQGAVTAAKTWQNLGPEIRLTNTLALPEPVSIPDNTASGVDRTFDLSSISSTFRVEHVTLLVDIAHAARGDLAIRLTSPSGTISRLAERHNDSNPNFPNHPFSSVLHWGESARGIWRVRIVDLRAGSTGSVRSLALIVHGAEPVVLPQPVLRVLTASGVLPVRFEVEAGAAGIFEIQVSENLVQWILQRTTNAPSRFEFEDPASVFLQNRFFRVLRQP